ncbi:tripartite tricarboxylate transporter substrate binding protein [Roseomonas sp. PWR1]|uniref:Tripartite tricarboxylate transporter substrate binding protein n=1 Tax=Roseomonas nitratireducens TaxID=2820810 RepID=A0ABS4APC6_9PROT|nr:tripartite tricarboxylate transporter substrate-binding protein [Neoroseomonas nitratireducens]MBP0463219.1 tripartite tricarboxylate transporter substrate binding protein [Neoroseomonas nitratireducens]
MHPRFAPTRRALLAGAAALAAPAAARAQDGWPTRPVRIVVPFPPGGSNDVVARPLADRLQRRLGQPVVIENRAGAGGAIGATAVAQSPADGYTLMVSSSSFATTSIAQRVPWGVLENFTPVALLARSPFIVLVHPDFPARSVQDLVRIARERPGAIDFGSSGPGGINHFVTEYFCLRAGIRMNHVPYRGMPPAVTDLVAGHIPVLITTMPSAAAVVREGRVRLLAYTAPGAPEGAPPAPLVKDAGIDYESDIWWGLFAPRGLPEPLLARLNAETNAALRDPDMARLFQAEGARPSPATPAEFSELLRVELARWREVAQAANIRPEG